MWKLPEQPVACGITDSEWPSFHSWCPSSRGLFHSLPELPAVWERAPRPGNRKAKPWEALLHNLLFVYSFDGKGTFSAQSLPVHPARSAKSFSWLKRGGWWLNGSKRFLTRHLLSLHTTQSSHRDPLLTKGKETFIKSRSESQLQNGFVD